MDENKTNDTAAKAAEPLVLEIAGRKFDVSTEKGRIEHKAWAEAISTLVGRQSNEVGELRKFKSAVAPTDNEVELLTKVSDLREQGDHAQADKMLFGFAKQTAEKSRRQLDVERANEKTWRAYLKERQELTSIFDEETIRSVSEAKLNLYEAEDPFKALDAFWMPRVKGEAKTSANSDKPPVVLQGAASRTAPVTKNDTTSAPADDMVDINSFLDSLPNRK